MNIQVILLVILLGLMAAVGGKRGVRSFFTLLLNFLTLFLALILIAIGADPVVVTLIFSVAISLVTLFLTNGQNAKTVAALLSVVLVVMLTMLMTWPFSAGAKIQGFAPEQAEGLAYMSVFIRVPFARVVTPVILLGLLGAVIDVAISVASPVYEIHLSQPEMPVYVLFRAGMSIGRDILGTMTNTLLFAFGGGFMTLVIWFSTLNYSFADILNSKVLSAELFQIIISGIGIALVIPVTALMSAVLVRRTRNTPPEEIGETQQEAVSADSATTGG